MRKLLFGAILLLLAGLLVTILDRYQGSEPAPVTKLVQTPDDLRLERIDYSENQAGKTVWRLQADSGGYRLVNQRTRLQQIRLTVFEQGDLGDLQLRADRGIWFQKRGELELEGHVRFSSSVGHEVRTERADFATGTGLLRAPGEVWLKTPQLVLEGEGMSLDTKTRQLHLAKQVKAELRYLTGKTGR